MKKDLRSDIGRIVGAEVLGEPSSVKTKKPKFKKFRVTWESGVQTEHVEHDNFREAFFRAMKEEGILDSLRAGHKLACYMKSDLGNVYRIGDISAITLVE